MNDDEPDDDSKGTEDGDVEGSDYDDDDDDDDDDGSLSGHARRSAYVGRVNVKDVCSSDFHCPILFNVSTTFRMRGGKTLKNEVNTNTQITPNDI